MKILICCLLLACAASALAQPADLAMFAEGGMSANAYKGDLSTSYDNWTAAYHGSLWLTRRQRLNGTFQVSFGEVVAQERAPTFVETLPPDADPVNFVETSFFSLHYALAFNLIRTDRFRLYFSQGLGLLRFVPRDARGEELSDRLATRAEGEDFNNVTALLPTSLGVVYFFPNQFGFGFQGGWLNPATDYLDNTAKYGTRDGNDRIAAYRFSLWVPLKRAAPTAVPE